MHRHSPYLLHRPSAWTSPLTPHSVRPEVLSPSNPETEAPSQSPTTSSSLNQTFCWSLFCTSRPVVTHGQSDQHSCDSQLFRCMKEMNKCFSFHQSQSSTSLCTRHCTVHGRHFPSISPSPQQTAVVLVYKKRVLKVTKKTCFCLYRARGVLSALISPTPLWLNMQLKLRGEGNGWADILCPTHIHSLSRP